MEHIAIDGPAGVPQDPRPNRGDLIRKSDASKKKGQLDSVSFQSGKYLQAIEGRKTSLLESPFLRQARVDAAKDAIDSGNLLTQEAIDEAAENLLRGDDAEEIELEEL